MEERERDGVGVPAKKAKTLCKYLNKWEEAYPYLTKSNIGQSHAFCKICYNDFSVSHGGKSDVSQNDKSAKHKRAQETQKHAQPITSFVTTNVCEAAQVTKAEVKMSIFAPKIMCALSFCDDFNRNVADMFLTLPLLGSTRREKRKPRNSSKVRYRLQKYVAF